MAEKIDREDQRLGNDRGPECSRAADAFQKKRRQKQAKDHAVENRADDIRGLDEISARLAKRAKPIATTPQSAVNHFEAAT